MIYHYDNKGMAEYLIAFNKYNVVYDKKDKYTQWYFDNNFYTDGGAIRRFAQQQNDDGCTVSPKERRIELYSVLHHFLNKNQVKINEFVGYSKVIYDFNEETFCICGQKSRLFLCEHLESGEQFYMGSECIKLFQPSFEAEGDKGVCSICAVKLRMKSNKKKEKMRNYDGNCKNICMLCNPINKLIRKDFLDTWRIYYKTFRILSSYFRTFKAILVIKRKDKEIMSDIMYYYKKYLNDKKQKNIKILQLLRHQTNYMLKYRK